MAFIDDQITVIRHQIGYLAPTHKALNQRDIYDARRLAAATANDADILRIDIEECL